MRELINLKETFIEAKRLGAEYRHYCYNLLAMQQVLTIPPMPNEVDEPSNLLGRGFWRFFPEALFFLPLIVYLRLFVHDLQTMDLATTIDWFSSLTLALLSLGFLIVLLAFTIICWRLSREVSGTWKREADLLATEDKEWEGSAQDVRANETTKRTARQSTKP